MINIENVDIMGWEAAIRGMRNPMNSWEKSDSRCTNYCADCTDREKCDSPIGLPYRSGSYVGPNDHSLMQRLAKAGIDHRKFMRMMPVYVRITAPLYW